MGCNSPGATHHLACDCREREWAERLAGADRALFAERERVVRAELRAASLSQELLAAEKAREEADAYAGRANARIADLGELLDATEAVLRDAESRAARLGEALREIESRTGHFGEAPPPPEWMPMLSLIAWVGKTARAALAEVGE